MRAKLTRDPKFEQLEAEYLEAERQVNSQKPSTSKNSADTYVLLKLNLFIIN